MDIGSASVTSDKKIALQGVFDESNPIVVLTSAAGQSTTLTCVTTSAVAATCDVGALATGNYTVMYDFTCKDSGNKKDALAIADSVPTMLDIP